MSDWIEKNNSHILEGFGNKFVVCSVLYSKQLPPKWEIKQSPFLLDVNKRFETLDKAKAYCEDRYKELNGQREKITRLRADLAAVTEERDALAARLAPVEDEALLVIAGKALCPEIFPDAFNAYGGLWVTDKQDRVLGLARAAISAIRPHIEAAERERCAKIASGLCESCGGEGWLWAHELGIGLRNDDTKYSCDGQGESIACKIAAAIRSGK